MKRCFIKKIATILLLTIAIVSGRMINASAAYGSYLLLNINLNQSIATSSNQYIPNGGYIYTSNYSSSKLNLYGELYRDDPAPIPNTLIVSEYMAPGETVNRTLNSIKNAQHFTELNPAGPGYTGCNGSIGYYFN